MTRAQLATVILFIGCTAMAVADERQTAGRNVAGVQNDQRMEQTMQQHPYIGMWVTGDGQIRQELLANNRYDEARGSRQSAYQGRYEVRENEIFYWDDTGFTADGIFVNDDELHHGGMIFFREK